MEPANIVDELLAENKALQAENERLRKMLSEAVTEIKDYMKAERNMNQDGTFPSKWYEDRYKRDLLSLRDYEEALTQPNKEE